MYDLPERAQWLPPGSSIKKESESLRSGCVKRDLPWGLDTLNPLCLLQQFSLCPLSTVALEDLLALVCRVWNTEVNSGSACSIAELYPSPALQFSVWLPNSL